jgi:hypothetical protein
MHDGLNQELAKRLDKLKGIDKHPITALTKSYSGKQTQWKNDLLKHDCSTLILKGGADPVTQKGQAEYCFEHLLASKEKILFEFPGVGHSMALPNLDPPAPGKKNLLERRIQKKGEAEDKITRYLSPRDKLIDEFLTTGKCTALKNSAIVKALETAFRTSIEQLDEDVVNGIRRPLIVTLPTTDITQSSDSIRGQPIKEPA